MLTVPLNIEDRTLLLSTLSLCLSPFGHSLPSLFSLSLWSFILFSMSSGLFHLSLQTLEPYETHKHTHWTVTWRKSRTCLMEHAEQITGTQVGDGKMQYEDTSKGALCKRSVCAKQQQNRQAVLGKRSRNLTVNTNFAVSYRSDLELRILVPTASNKTWPGDFSVPSSKQTNLPRVQAVECTENRHTNKVEKRGTSNWEIWTHERSPGKHA